MLQLNFCSVQHPFGTPRCGFSLKSVYFVSPNSAPLNAQKANTSGAWAPLPPGVSSSVHRWFVVRLGQHEKRPQDGQKRGASDKK